MPQQALQEQRTSTLAFISGPLDVSTAYFDRYYRQAIDKAIESGHTFVIGPVTGIDTLAFEYLLSPDVHPSRIRIYMASFEIASQPAFVSQIRKQSGEDAIVEAKKPDGEPAQTTWDRDAAMTRDSDYDILRFRTEWEQKSIYGERWRPRVSNTERNWRRRKGEYAEAQDIAYISHVDGHHNEERRLIDVFKGRRNPGAKDASTSRCDGLCNAHRDVVYGKSAFGFGNDGVRTT